MNASLCKLPLELLRDMKILLLLLIYRPAQLPNVQMCFYVLWRGHRPVARTSARAEST